jgi:poly-gamma-glutamate synthase PgsB/CapB
LLAGLALEARRARRDRAALRDVVYVNGTRGKSTVSRLIDAGLRAGGLRVFCKTTGTVPLMIDTQNRELPVARRGRANIKEQLSILRRAAAEGADVLVLECMAVSPALQRISQHRMVKADLGVITNVRLDHTEEMGETLEEICDSLSSTIPRDGRLFTADPVFYPQLCQNAEKLGTPVTLAQAEDAPYDFDFPENIALALCVCEALGVPRQTALSGMENFRRDPCALSIHLLPGGAVAINALSINDPQSTERVFRDLAQRYGLSRRRLVLLINNRADRGYRTGHMLALADRLSPDEVWLLGASQRLMRRRLQKLLGPSVPVRRCRSAKEVPLELLSGDDFLFAAGNVADQGKALIARLEKEGVPCTMKS